METVTLADLGPIIAAILGPMIAFVVVAMRYQHQDSLKTRELLSQVKAELTGEITGVKAELTEVKMELTGVKAELTGVKAELTGEITGVKAELTGEITGLKAELTGVKAELTGELTGVKAELTEVKMELTGVKAELTGELTGVKAETRQLISDSNKEIREWVTEQFERLSDRLSAELKDLGRGLADARERLARIEGHFGIDHAPPRDERGEQGSNAA